MAVIASWSLSSALCAASDAGKGSQYAEPPAYRLRALIWRTGCRRGVAQRDDEQRARRSNEENVEGTILYQ